ncbi:MAG: cyclic nucleotide-binding domain-containing protein [Planctomycetota bacterium]|nr:cyclic nucleotide-binding domain-containing protein [Planctomycetota bacterium]
MSSKHRTDDPAHWRTLDPFRSLSDIAWESAQALLRRRDVPGDETIVRAGDPAEEAYLLLSGHARVVQGDEDVSELLEGTVFGEQGLLAGGVRGATVVASEPCELLVISIEAFDFIAQEQPEWLERLRIEGARQAETSLVTGRVLRALFEQTAENEHRAFDPGATLVTRGEPSDGVHLLEEGEVEIIGRTGDVLDRAGPGACIGELGCLLDLPRTASVRALKATRTLWLDAETFRARLSGDPLAEQVLRKLWYGYRFERSFVRQLSTMREPGPGRRTIYSLIDGRTIAVFRPDGGESYQADLTAGAAPGERRELSWGGTPERPWLTLTLVDRESDAQVVRVRAALNRPEGADAFNLLLDDTPITAEMERAFARLGRVAAPSKVIADLLCRCMNVSRSAVQDAIAGGLTTRAEVEAATGCGGVCGGCHVHIDSMLSNVDSDDERRSVAPAGPEVEIHVPLLARWTARFGRAAATSLGLWGYLSPGLAVALSLSLPFIALHSPRAALVTGLFVALIFAVDLRAARRQWHEVFGQTIAPPVGIRAGETRPAGFAEDGVHAIRAIVMRELPFWSWVNYKYTLRQLYILNSSWRWLRHQLRKRLLSRGYERARSWGRRSRPFWGDVPREIAELCLETSLCLGMVDASEDESGKRIGTLRFTNWLCPAAMSDGREVAAVETLEVKVDLEDRVALSCNVNGEEIGVTRHALCWVYVALSAYQHTMLHAYGNWAADPRHDDRHVRQGARWTLATNAVALYSGTAFQSDPRSFQRVARHNAAKSMFRHGYGPMMDVITEHSHYARFILEARRVFMQVMQAQGVDVDLEALFLMTVVHSLDHHMACVSVDPVDLIPEDVGYHPAETVRVVFSEPLEPFMINTRLSSIRSGWPRELYEALRPIDPELARYVDIGISY